MLTSPRHLTSIEKHTGMLGDCVQTLAVDDFVQRRTDKNYALADMNGESQTVDKDMRLVRLSSNANSMSIEMCVRTLTFEDRATVNPQIK